MGRNKKARARQLPVVSGHLVESHDGLTRLVSQVVLWFEKECLDDLDLRALAGQFSENPRFAAVLPTRAMRELLEAVRDNDEERARRVLKTYFTGLERNLISVRDEISAAYEQLEGYTREVGGQGLRERLVREKESVTDGITKMVYRRFEQVLGLDRELDGLVIENRSKRRSVQEKRDTLERYLDTVCRLAKDTLLGVLSRVGAGEVEVEALCQAKDEFIRVQTKAGELLLDLRKVVAETEAIQIRFGEFCSRRAKIARGIADLERMFGEAELPTPYELCGIRREDIANRADTARCAGEFFAEVGVPEIRDPSALLAEVEAVIVCQRQGKDSLFNDNPTRAEELSRLLLVAYVVLYPSERQYRKSARVVGRDILSKELGWVRPEEAAEIKTIAARLASEGLLDVKDYARRKFPDPWYRATELGRVRVRTWERLLRRPWSEIVSELQTALRQQQEAARENRKQFVLLKGKED